MDIDKIKVGDKVLIEVTVDNCEYGYIGFYMHKNKFSEKTGLFYNLDPKVEVNYKVVGHIPAPHIWRSGDRFRSGLHNALRENYTILFIDERSVFLEYESNGRRSIISTKQFEDYCPIYIEPTI